MNSDMTLDQQLKYYIEKTKAVVTSLKELGQPSKLTVRLPLPRTVVIKDSLKTFEEEEAEPDRERTAEAAQDLADQLRLEAGRHSRALGVIGRSIKTAATDADVCDPQFQEIEDERKRREAIVRPLLETATGFDSIALKYVQPIVKPPMPGITKGKPGKEVDDILDRARAEIDIAAGDKDRALRRHDHEQKQKAKHVKGGAAPEAYALNEYDPNVRKVFEDSANIAHVASAEAQLAIAGALRDIAANPVGSPGRPLRVQMRRADHADTPDTPFWMYIRHATTSIGWEAYSQFMEDVVCADPNSPEADLPNRTRVLNRPLRLPFPDTDAYRFLKVATEVFLMVNCGVWGTWSGPNSDELAYADRRLGGPPTEITRQWASYLMPTGGTPRMLPYLALIRQKLGDQSIVDWSRGDDFTQRLAACSGIIRERLETPCLLELIWSYWHEEGMLVQTMNAISRRFQNIRTPGDRDPLAMVEIDPLRPLNNFLWGYIQDEQHRLTVARRAYEYDHHYGLSLVGRAVPGVKGADSRKRFLEAFHQLLHLCTIFFKEDDDTTVIADGFPVLNALREVHIILSQGAHNQYGDLPWTARQEMLIQEWLLSRGEMREFLPSRIMVAYPEPWMDRVDAMKQLMGWTDTSVRHCRERGIYGERILLGARFNDWTTVIEPERAANWARFWRPEINSYIHAYRAVTGIDLNERSDATMPSTLLRNRLAAQRVGSR
jgi:hypothetical protein